LAQLMKYIICVTKTGFLETFYIYRHEVGLI